MANRTFFCNTGFSFSLKGVWKAGFCFVIEILLIVCLFSSCAFLKNSFRNPATRSTVYGGSFESVFQYAQNALRALDYNIISADIDTGHIKAELNSIVLDSADANDESQPFIFELILKAGKYKGGVDIDYNKYKMVKRTDIDGNEIFEESFVKDERLFSNILQKVRKEIRYN